jgi:hypothetical protein
MAQTQRPRRVVVATHGHCFDGMASAALFTWLYRSLEGPNASFAYHACEYGPGDGGVPSGWLNGDENAVLDYRYSPARGLTWYFDHHATAFQSAGDREHYEARRGLRGAYDPAYPSCTKLIADVAERQFGLSLPEHMRDLVAWADRIDAARFADVREAVERADPVLQLMTVAEHHGHSHFVAILVPRLLSKPVGQVAVGDDVQSLYGPLARKRAGAVAAIEARAKLVGRVALCDLADVATEFVEKFALYALFPQSLYGVTVTRTPSKLKVSVGYNPWAAAPRAHDIGSICRRYGGGGHAVVGAFARSVDKVDEARSIALQVVEELQG